MTESPCRDCLTYALCRNQLINRYKYQIEVFSNNLLTKQDEMTLACHFTLIQKCTKFCLFATRLSSLEEAIDTSIYKAAAKSFNGIEDLVRKNKND